MEIGVPPHRQHVQPWARIEVALGQRQQRGVGHQVLHFGLGQQFRYRVVIPHRTRCGGFVARHHRWPGFGLAVHRAHAGRRGQRKLHQSLAHRFGQRSGHHVVPVALQVLQRGGAGLARHVAQHATGRRQGQELLVAADLRAAPFIETPAALAEKVHQRRVRAHRGTSEETVDQHAHAEKHRVPQGIKNFFHGA